MLLLGKWKEPEIVVLSEISQLRETSTRCFLSCMESRLKQRNHEVKGALGKRKGIKRSWEVREGVGW